MASSSSLSSIQLSHPPRVNEKAFIGVAWGGVALAGLFLISRIYARIVAFHRLYWDDFFAVTAWGLLLASTIIWQIVKNYLYDNLNVSSGLLYPPPPNFQENTVTYLRASTAVIIFFYSGLWFVKFSFLIFFRRLGSKVRHQNVLWWCVTVIVVTSWLATLGTLEYPCLTGDFLYIEENCTTDYAINFQRSTLTANMCIDVITDLLIMLIPISILWKVRISGRQKLALFGIFSLTVLIMIFAVVRVSVVTSWSFGPDESWLYLWSSIEQTVSIVVVCLASFRLLFTRQETSPRYRPTHDYSGASGATAKRGFQKSSRIRTWLSTRERATQQVPEQDEHPFEELPQPHLQGSENDSISNMIPAHQIHVRSEFQTTSTQQELNKEARSGYHMKDGFFRPEP